MSNLVTPWTAAYQALPSMGFSRQEYWSGVPLPSLLSPLVTTNLFSRFMTIKEHFSLVKCSEKLMRMCIFMEVENVLWIN